MCLAIYNINIFSNKGRIRIDLQTTKQQSLDAKNNLLLQHNQLFTTVVLLVPSYRICLLNEIYNISNRILYSQILRAEIY